MNFLTNYNLLEVDHSQVVCIQVKVYTFNEVTPNCLIILWISARMWYLSSQVFIWNMFYHFFLSFFIIFLYANVGYPGHQRAKVADISKFGRPVSSFVVGCFLFVVILCYIIINFDLVG